jgi:hypothetical protein
MAESTTAALTEGTRRGTENWPGRELLIQLGETNLILGDFVLNSSALPLFRKYTLLYHLMFILCVMKT